MKKYIVDEKELDSLIFNAAIKIMNVLEKCSESEIINIYGIPRGGIPVAFGIVSLLQNNYALNARIVYNPSLATFIVDDLVDSGNTAKEYFGYLQNEKFFIPLIDKKAVDLQDFWIVFPWEVVGDVEQSAEDIPLRFLQYIGEDVEREGLLDTPKRVVKTWEHLYSGYNADVEKLFTVFDNPQCDEMVILDNIEFYSTCEHHILPFFGKCHIAYIPDKKVVGISKLARVVEAFARRLQIQENLTSQIALTIQEYLQPLGVGVIMQAQHFCMTSRGVQKQNSVMKTSSLLGVFKKPEVRAEFLKLITMR